MAVKKARSLSISSAVGAREDWLDGTIWGKRMRSTAVVKAELALS